MIGFRKGRMLFLHKNDFLEPSNQSHKCNVMKVPEKKYLKEKLYDFVYEVCFCEKISLLFWRWVFTVLNAHKILKQCSSFMSSYNLG